MSRLEAFMVAIGMILLGMAAARADEPAKLPDIIRGTGPAVEQAPAAPQPPPALARADACEPVAIVPVGRERHRGGTLAVHKVRHDAPARRIDRAIVPAFSGPIVPHFR